MNKAILFFAPLFSLIANPAYAYLDPGTGSLVTSIIVGAVATLIYIGKDWFYSLKNKMKKK